MKKLIIFLTLFVAGLMANDLYAQMLTMDYECAETGDTGSLLMTGSGIAFDFRGQKISMIPSNVAPQGMVYTNMAGVNALMPFDLQSLILQIGRNTYTLQLSNARAVGAPSAMTAPANNNGGGSRITTKQCSLCHGKGWIAGTSTPTYGNSSSYYCPDCGRNVPASHSHDKCPSCNGKGTIQSIR